MKGILFAKIFAVIQRQSQQFQSRVTGAK